MDIRDGRATVSGEPLVVTASFGGKPPGHDGIDPRITMLVRTFILP